MKFDRNHADHYNYSYYSAISEFSDKCIKKCVKNFGFTMTKLALDFPIYMIGPISHVFLRFYKLLDLAQFDLTMPNLSKV